MQAGSRFAARPHSGLVARMAVLKRRSANVIDAGALGVLNPHAQLDPMLHLLGQAALHQRGLLQGKLIQPA